MTRYVVLLFLLAFQACSKNVGDTVNGKQTPLASYTVACSDLDIIISETGHLKSAKPVLIKAKEGGKVLMVVKEGTTVKKDDVLIQLENKDLVERLRTISVDIEITQRSIIDAEAELKLVELDSTKQLNDAERVLRLAKLALQQYVEGKAPLQDQTLDIAVRKAMNAQKDADEKLARMPELLEKQFVTPAELRTAKLESEEQAATAHKATRDLEIFRQFERPQEEARLQGEVSGAEIGLTTAQQQKSTKLSQKESSLHRQSEDLKQKEKVQKDTQDQLNSLEIRAPSDGVVVYGNPDQHYYGGDDNKLDIGADVYQNRVFMSLPDLSNMVAEVAIKEINVTKVTPGMSVTVTVEGLDKIFSGKIERIDNAAQQQWGEDTRKYSAIVTLSGTEGVHFRHGMSCRADIQVAHVPKTIHIPIDAVTVRQDHAWCWTPGSDGHSVRRTVKLGLSSNERVQILEGLTAGETVLVFAVEPEVSALDLPLTSASAPKK